jgi:hypothetical protein
VIDHRQSTLCRFPYDSGRIAAALTQPSAFVYAPARGASGARTAIAGFLASGDVSVSPDRIFTASSSGIPTLRLPVMPGSVAIPADTRCSRPARPTMSPQAYRIRYAGGWQLEGARAAGGAETRAIVIHRTIPPVFPLPDEQQ